MVGTGGTLLLSTLECGVYEEAAAGAVVVEAKGHNNRQPKQGWVNFGSSLPGEGASEYHGNNLDCKGYSMLGCI